MSRTSRALLSWCVATLITAGTLSAIVLPASRAGSAEAGLSPGERQVAETLYANHCATCHGASGAGGVIPGTDDAVPPLVGNPDVTVPALDLTLRVGRMPPPENDPYDNRARTVLLDERERDLMVRYLADAFDIEGTVPAPPEGDVRRGREVFATNCAQCHGSTGAGGVAGGGAWTPPVIDRDAVAIAEAIRVGPFEMPAFAPEQISDAEIGDVVAFVDFVAQEQGTPLGLTELNPVYASGFAFVFAVIVLLSALWIAGKPSHFPDPAESPSDEEVQR